MHQLDWISIEGFKSIANSGKIELRPINLVIGANGAGKSNFLEIFEYLKEFRGSFFQRYVQTSGGAGAVLHSGTIAKDQVHVQHSIRSGAVEFDYCAVAGGDDSLHVQTDCIKVFNNGHFESHDLTMGSIVPDGTEEAHIKLQQQLFELGIWIYEVVKFHIHDTSKTSALRRTNKTDDNDYLRPDGSNLAAFLYRLQIRFPNDYSMIVKTVQRIAPFFEDFLLRPDNLNPEFIKLAWTHKGTDKYFGASSLSDGTLRFIALTTLLLQPIELRPSVILIDEPELGLHPEAIGLLASLIKLASVDTQIIAATQSPTLLDHFAPEDVLVAERVNGGTVFNRLNSEKLQIWLEDYSLGQLWEKNEIGGNPLPETSK